MKRRWKKKKAQTPHREAMPEGTGAADKAPPPDLDGVSADQPTQAPPEPGPVLTEEDEGYLLQMQRLQAEFANYRKRILRERAEWEDRAKGDFVNGLIPILDDLSRAREAHASNPPSSEAEGLLLILSRLEESLMGAGLERQDTAAGTIFDPHVHEALAGSSSEEYPEGTIIETLQPGYLFRGLMLRPARVRVSQGPSVALS